MAEQGRDGPVLDQHAEWRGHWWLPGMSEMERIPGTLLYSPEGGLTLDLIGELVDLEGDDFPILVLGLAQGEPVSLLECGSIHGSKRNGVAVESIQIGAAVIGIHLDSPLEAVFASLEVLYENSTSWAGHSTLTQHSEPAEDGGAWTLKLAPGPTLTATVDGHTVELFHYGRSIWNESTRDGKSGSLVDRLPFRVTSSQPMTYLAALSWVKELQGLVSAAAGSAQGVLWWTMKGVDGLQVSIYTSTWPGAKQLTIDYGIVFHLDAERFAAIVANWFARNRQHRVAWDLILGTWYQGSGYVEPFFAAIMAAAEVAHTGLKEPAPIPPAELEELVEAAAAAVPAERQSWLRAVIPKGHSLRQRLESLAARLPQQVADRLLPSVENWTRFTVGARNDLAHRGGTKRDSEALYAAARVTSAVVYINLLQQLQIEPDRLLTAVKTNRDLVEAARLSKVFFSDSE